MATAWKAAWQIFGEPSLAQTYTPVSGDVFRSIDKEARRIGWDKIWRYGHVKAIRKTDDGRWLLFKTYPFTAFSGRLGPMRLAPEEGPVVLAAIAGDLHEVALRLADRGETVVIVTHNLNVAARFADRLLLLDHGRVAAEGEPPRVLARAVLEPVYAWPLAVAPHPGPGSDEGAPQLVPLRKEGRR